MKLTDVNLMSKNELANQYRQEGMAVLRGVTLPDVFDPPVTDFVFLNVDQNCEVFIGSNVRYQGRARQWRPVFRQEPGPGGTLHLLTTSGDFFTGFGKAKAMLEQAGGAYPAQEEQPAAVAAPEPVRANTPAAAQAQQPAQQQTPFEMDRPLPEYVPEQQNQPQEQAPAQRQQRNNGLRDLVEEWRRNPRDIYSREDVLTSLITSLCRESKPGVILLGKAGTGKTTTVEALARAIALNENIPPALANTPIYDLPIGHLLENTRHVGDIERQARRILEGPGRPVFFVDEIHQLAREELHSLRDILKPALAVGQIRMIGATTPPEWRKLEDRAFKRRFFEIAVEEPAPDEAFVMLKERSKAVARHHGIEISEDALRQAVMLGARYLPMRQFPDKAVDVVDLAAALQVLKQNGRTQDGPQNNNDAVAPEENNAGDNRTENTQTPAGPVPEENPDNDPVSEEISAATP